jgi:hypothetical protein
MVKAAQLILDASSTKFSLAPEPGKSCRRDDAQA